MECVPQVIDFISQSEYNTGTQSIVFSVFYSISTLQDLLYSLVGVSNLPARKCTVININYFLN